MTVETNQDETAGFVTSSSDLQDEVSTAQEAQADDEPASSDADATEAEEKPESSESDDSGKDSDTAAQDKANKSNGVQKRIDKVVREREELRRQNEAKDRRIAELEGKGNSDVSKEPVESDFETYDEYLDALDAYDNKPESPESKKPESKGDDKEALTDSQKTAMAVIRESIEAASKPDDFEQVALDPKVAITGDMLEALAECEDPAKVMYHLGKNTDLAAEIASGSPAQQMRAIAKLDLTVTSKPPKPTKTTNAPDPIVPVGGASVHEKSVSEMSFSEYEAHMNKKEQAKKSW